MNGEMRFEVDRITSADIANLALPTSVAININIHITLSTQNEPPPPQFTTTENSDFPVQMQIGPNFQFEFVPRDTKESEFSIFVDFGGGSFAVESDT